MLLHQFNFNFPATLNSPSPSSYPQIKPQILSPISRRGFPSFARHGSRRTAPRRSTLRDEMDDESVNDSDFFNENGAVEDMDAYLNFLSLEYDSVWDTKPSWCQPWTIWSTGIAIITGSWVVLNSIVITSVIAAVICLWWYLFLYSYPKFVIFLRHIQI
ncbi:uncharacterized protein LOC127244042 isoform X2 [Andrographis paniculata]|uniref:uncharacterized protein LOC127244042 isoform X2 n=1 Tax=Andrographis paniculata TaxID=175694 RepID=UPI0021E9AA4F|nr:uncharacterized protein LOC127244042 isoform X2 [Andrographis paniculata]